MIYGENRRKSAEKQEKLGGNLHPAGAAYFKEDILKLIKEKKDKLILIKTSYVLKCPQYI